MTGWSIQELLQNDRLLKAAKADWEKSSIGQASLNLSSIVEDFDRAEWFESKLVELRNNYAQITCVSAYSKQWWNEEVAGMKTIDRS